MSRSGKKAGDRVARKVLIIGVDAENIYRVLDNTHAVDSVCRNRTIN